MKNHTSYKKGKEHPLFGTTHSIEWKKMMSEKLKGKPSYWKGKKLSDETKRKMKLAHSGNKNHFYGKKHDLETRKKMKKNRRTKCLGEKNHSWKGGVTPVFEKIRHSIEYELWRTAVFERDNYTCVWCGDNKGGNLNADHIQLFSTNPELRFAIDNGRTLCIACHHKRHSKK